MTKLSGHTKIENNELLIEIDIPGYEKSEIAIEVEHSNSFGSIVSTIYITAENTDRGIAKCYVPLDSRFDVDEASANLANGVLKINIPKKSAYKNKTIAIN